MSTIEESTPNESTTPKLNRNDSTDSKTLFKGKPRRVEKNDPLRFSGQGVTFKAKLIGIEDVPDARGDKMCQDAMIKLKAMVKVAGEHKQRINVNVSLEGLKILEDKSGVVLHHHKVHRISFISRDASDGRAFGYIYGPGDGSHRFFGIKTDKAAEGIVLTLRDLFQVVFEIKKREVEEAKKQKEEENKATQDKSNAGSPANESTSSEMATTAEGTKPPEEAASGLGNLLDLESELNSLSQGIAQMNTQQVPNSPGLWSNNSNTMSSPSLSQGGSQPAFPVNFPPTGAQQGDPFAAMAQRNSPVPASSVGFPGNSDPFASDPWGNQPAGGQLAPPPGTGSPRRSSPTSQLAQDPFFAPDPSGDKFAAIKHLSGGASNENIPGHTSPSNPFMPAAGGAIDLFSANPLNPAQGAKSASPAPQESKSAGADPFAAFGDLTSLSGPKPFVTKDDFFKQPPKPSVAQLQTQTGATNQNIFGAPGVPVSDDLDKENPSEDEDSTSDTDVAKKAPPDMHDSLRQKAQAKPEAFESPPLPDTPPPKSENPGDGPEDPLPSLPKLSSLQRQPISSRSLRHIKGHGFVSANDDSSVLPSRPKLGEAWGGKSYSVDVGPSPLDTQSNSNSNIPIAPEASSTLPNPRPRSKTPATDPSTSRLTSINDEISGIAAGMKTTDKKRPESPIARPRPKPRSRTPGIELASMKWSSMDSPRLVRHHTGSPRMKHKRPSHSPDSNKENKSAIHVCIRPRKEKDTISDTISVNSDKYIGSDSASIQSFEHTSVSIRSRSPRAHSNPSPISSSQDPFDESVDPFTSQLTDLQFTTRAVTVGSESDDPFSQVPYAHDDPFAGEDPFEDTSSNASSRHKSESSSVTEAKPQETKPPVDPTANDLFQNIPSNQNSNNWSETFTKLDKNDPDVGSNNNFASFDSNIPPSSGVANFANFDSSCDVKSETSDKSENNNANFASWSQAEQGDSDSLKNVDKLGSIRPSPSFPEKFNDLSPDPTPSLSQNKTILPGTVLPRKDSTSSSSSLTASLPPNRSASSLKGLDKSQGSETPPPPPARKISGNTFPPVKFNVEFGSPEAKPDWAFKDCISDERTAEPVPGKGMSSQHSSSTDATISKPIETKSADSGNTLSAHATMGQEGTHSVPKSNIPSSFSSDFVNEPVIPNSFSTDFSTFDPKIPNSFSSDFSAATQLPSSFSSDFISQDIAPKSSVTESSVPKVDCEDSRSSSPSSDESEHVKESNALSKESQSFNPSVQRSDLVVKSEVITRNSQSPSFVSKSTSLPKDFNASDKESASLPPAEIPPTIPSPKDPFILKLNRDDLLSSSITDKLPGDDDDEEEDPFVLDEETKSFSKRIAQSSLQDSSLGVSQTSGQSVFPSPGLSQSSQSNMSSVFTTPPSVPERKTPSPFTSLPPVPDRNNPMTYTTPPTIPDRSRATAFVTPPSVPERKQQQPVSSTPDSSSLQSTFTSPPFPQDKLASFPTTPPQTDSSPDDPFVIKFDTKSFMSEPVAQSSPIAPSNNQPVQSKPFTEIASQSDSTVAQSTPTTLAKTDDSSGKLDPFAVDFARNFPPTSCISSVNRQMTVDDSRSSSSYYGSDRSFDGHHIGSNFQRQQTMDTSYLSGSPNQSVPFPSSTPDPFGKLDAFAGVSVPQYVNASMFGNKSANQIVPGQSGDSALSQSPQMFDSSSFNQSEMMYASSAYAQQQQMAYAAAAPQQQQQQPVYATQQQAVYPHPQQTAAFPPQQQQQYQQQYSYPQHYQYASAPQANYPPQYAQQMAPHPGAGMPPQMVNGAVPPYGMPPARMPAQQMQVPPQQMYGQQMYGQPQGYAHQQWMQ